MVVSPAIKAAVTLVTDKRFWKIIIGIIIAVMLLLSSCTYACTNSQLSTYAAASDYTYLFFEKYQDRIDAVNETLSEGTVDSGMVAALMYYFDNCESEEASNTTLDKILQCCITRNSVGDLIAITDRQIIAANVEAVFGVTLSDEEKTEIYTLADNIITDADKSVLIQNLDDNGEKTNIGLVNFAYNALKAGSVYIYGASGETVTINFLTEQYDKYSDDSFPYFTADITQQLYEENKGRLAFDSIGLIKAYVWINQNAEIQKNTNGIGDITVDDILSTDISEQGDIDDIPEIPGIAVYASHRIGIYVGNGYIIEAKDSSVNICKSELNTEEWDIWLKLPFIDYVDNGNYTVNGETIKIEDGQIVTEDGNSEVSESQDNETSRTTNISISENSENEADEYINIIDFPLSSKT